MNAVNNASPSLQAITVVGDDLPDPATVSAADALTAMQRESPDIRDLASLLSPAADTLLETMARRARALTRRHFGNTISLYTPLYLSDYCEGGCRYCGFAADRRRARSCLDEAERRAEMDAIADLGIEEILLLTGERSEAVGIDYVEAAVREAAARFHAVTVEVFPMASAEYARLVRAGCTGVTLYQETYHAAVYADMHRWGPKRDYRARLTAPENALQAGMRTVGLGVLLGLAPPVQDVIALVTHLQSLRRRWWRAGFSISFPRVRPEPGGFQPPHPVDDRLLARIILALRIFLPDVPLVLSTRESIGFRDGMAGLGIVKMSVASRTTVGGYRVKTGLPSNPADAATGQFHVNDHRDMDAFTAALRAKGLWPVLKNNDAVYRDAAADMALAEP